MSSKEHIGSIFKLFHAVLHLFAENPRYKQNAWNKQHFFAEVSAMCALLSMCSGSRITNSRTGGQGTSCAVLFRHYRRQSPPTRHQSFSALAFFICHVELTVHQTDKPYSLNVETKHLSCHHIVSPDLQLRSFSPINLYIV